MKRGRACGVGLTGARTAKPSGLGRRSPDSLSGDGSFGSLALAPLFAQSAARSPSFHEVVRYGTTWSRRFRAQGPGRFCLRAHGPRGRGLRDRLESSCANPVFGIPTVVEARDAHALASLPGMDEAAAADVNPAMTKAIEEHQIARLKAVAGDG